MNNNKAKIQVKKLILSSSKYQLILDKQFDYDYLIVGETADEGKYKIKNNGEIELLDDPLIQKAESFFDDILD